jgi:hypothetical protein
MREVYKRGVAQKGPMMACLSSESESIDQSIIGMARNV